MTLSLFASVDNFFFLIRWVHVFFGIIWIGHLYYFNFVQGLFFAETDATTKSNAIQQLVPKALWWFRWGAFWTMATGLLYIAYLGHREMALFTTSYGLWIITGATLGLIMGCNVWFIIWPNQKVVIASATQAAQGKGPIPEAAACAARAGLASRHNVLFSMPMLFCMLAGRHLTTAGSGNTAMTYGILAVLITALELNAIKGKMGPLTTIKGVVHMGAVLTLVVYLIIDLVPQM
jgi:uncharacterized membrane protein